MQPWPPCAIPGKLVEIAANLLALLADAIDLAGGVLDAGDVLQFEQPGHGLHAHVDYRARRDVVNNDRDADGVVDRLVVLIEPFLVWLVVVGRHYQQAIRPRLLGEAGQFDRLERIVGAGTGDHRHPARSDPDADVDHTLVLVVAQRRTLAGCSDRHQPMRSLADLPVDEGTKRLFVEATVAHRRYQCSDRSCEHAIPLPWPNSC